MRPALLLVDPETSRRRAVSEGLAEHGYEAVPVAELREGERFAAAIQPAVVVVAGANSPQTLLERFQAPPGGAGRTLVFLGEASEEDSEVPDEVFFLSVAGLAPEEIIRRIRLVLVGREVGVEPDLDLHFLVGELSLLPALELVRALSRARVSGRLVLPGGAVRMSGGEVVAARTGNAWGEKAFCRLGRLHDGPFRVHLEAPVAEHEREMTTPVDDLVLLVVEEVQLTFPDPRLEIQLLEVDETLPPDSGHYQPQLLAVLERCGTVGDLFDALPLAESLILKTLKRLVKHRVVALRKPRTGVKIITDSTADLPPDLVQAHDIKVVPLSILFGKDTFRDGVDIQPRDFYQLLESSEEHPRTQPPAREEFYEHFHDVIERQDILSIHISGKLSQTVEHARQAALEGSRSFHHLPPERHNFALEVVDSQTVSMGTGLLALCAARMAQRGEQVFHITRTLEALIPRIEILFVVNTLDYLVKGGRVGKAQALVGKLLGIKPILGVVDGEVAPVSRARGGRRAQRRIVEILKERFDPARPLMAAVAHARAPAWGDRLRVLLGQAFELREEIVTDIGPVVGTHAGPGCVGCVAIQPTEEEWELIGPPS